MEWIGLTILGVLLIVVVLLVVWAYLVKVNEISDLREEIVKLKHLLMSGIDEDE